MIAVLAGKERSDKEILIGWWFRARVRRIWVSVSYHFCHFCHFRNSSGPSFEWILLAITYFTYFLLFLSHYYNMQSTVHAAQPSFMDKTKGIGQVIYRNGNGKVRHTSATCAKKLVWGSAILVSFTSSLLVVTLQLWLTVIVIIGESVRSFLSLLIIYWVAVAQDVEQVIFLLGWQLNPLLILSSC